MAIRTITTSPLSKYSLSNPTIISDGGYTLLYLSRDRSTFYATSTGSASQQSKLNKSTDGGVTWTLIKEMNSVQTNGYINGMLELPSGEVLISMSPFNSFANQIYRSTGWVSNPATATWTSKTGGSLFNTQLIGIYGMNHRSIGTNGIILAAEGGAQTDGIATQGLTKISSGTGYTTATLSATSGGTGESFAVNITGGDIVRIAVLNGGTGHTNGTFHFSISGDGSGADWTYTVSGGVISGVQTAKARRLFLSTDFGENWSQIFDVYTTPTYKYGSGIHLHAVAYDEEWDRIWLLFGDNTGDGTTISGYPTNTQMYYSDDRGSTWTLYPAFPYVEGHSIKGQFTSIRIYKNNIVLGTDAMSTCFGSVIIPRIGFKQLGTPQFGPGFVLNTSIVQEQTSAYSVDDSYPAFMTLSAVSAANDPVVLISSDGGTTWNELWRETDFVTRPRITGGCIRTFLGPDTSNRVLGRYSGYSSFLQGTLVSN